MSFYHQSERDAAACVGCLALLAILIGGVLLVLCAALI